MKVFLLMFGIVNKRKKLVALPTSATTGRSQHLDLLDTLPQKFETMVFERDF